MPFITVALALGYLAAAYFLLFLPKIGPLLAGGDLDTALLEAQLQEREAHLGKLEAADDEFKKINADKKAKLTAVVPTEPDVPGILVAMDALAKKNGFVLTSIDTVVDEKTVSPAGNKIVRMSVNMAGGTYEMFKALLTDISHSLRLFDVQSVVFTPNSGNYAMVMRAYYYAKAPPAAAPEAVAPAVVEEP